ncbi:MAG TPA: Xaa-Pro peptidase family protein [Syntrophomonadaceae bacterium]|nr:Xaa-Pro peptidase family protein [Syntrophomonadaceae bacterium]
MIQREELESRVQRLQHQMQVNDCQGFLIMQNVDLLYFSGTMQNAQLYVPIQGQPLLFCRKSCERAGQESPWTLIPVINYKSIPEKMAELGCQIPLRLALEYDVIPVNSYLFCRKLFPQAEFMDGSSWIKHIRAVKSPAEIAALRTAGKNMALVFGQVAGMIRPGISEMTVATEVERLARQFNHQGPVRLRAFNQELFFGHLLSGVSGALASFNDGAAGGPGPGPFYPQGSGSRLLAAHEPIILDYVGCFDGYQVDQTRCFTIGALPDNVYHAFQVALEIQEAVTTSARPGVAPAALWNIALAKAEVEGLKDHFMGHGTDQAKFVGHGIGLEVDEYPVLTRGFNEPLQENTVFALEPKFVFPGQGMVGIENTWLVTSSGVEKITIFPDDLVVID